MKQVIWFFGSSASGKKTLIDAIVKSPDNFKTRLGLLNNNILVCKEALEWVTKKNHHERPNLISIILALIENEQEAVVLVKGQAPDLKHSLLNELSKLLPNIEQKIIFVYTDPQEELERWKKHRTWYNSSMTEQDVVEEIYYQLRLIEKLEPFSGSVICVDGGSNAHYQIIDYPPVIIK